MMRPKRPMADPKISMIRILNRESKSEKYADPHKVQNINLKKYSSQNQNLYGSLSYSISMSEKRRKMIWKFFNCLKKSVTRLKGSVRKKWFMGYRLTLIRQPLILLQSVASIRRKWLKTKNVGTKQIHGVALFHPDRR